MNDVIGNRRPPLDGWTVGALMLLAAGIGWACARLVTT